MHAEFLPTGLAGKFGRLVEECAEVLLAIGKIERFGLDSVNPLIPEDQRVTNRNALLGELSDLEHAIEEVRQEVKPPEAPRLTVADKNLLRRIQMEQVIILGGSTMCHHAEELVRRGYLVLYSAERSPTGKRWYRCTAVGLEALGMLQPA
jgi:hypothetical protein